MGEGNISYFRWSIWASEHPYNDAGRRIAQGDETDFLSAMRHAGANYKKLKVEYPDMNIWKIFYFTVGADGTQRWIDSGTLTAH